jgi:long-chain acyl-CoA synthetase
METIKIRVEGFDFEEVTSHLMQLSKDQAVSIQVNAPSPFTEDGWYNTGDAVEVSGEYLRFLGRKSDIINVGGEKVFPIEVESTIQELSNVQDVSVYGERNPITGNIVCARVTLKDETEGSKLFIARLKTFCRDKLQAYKVPVKVSIIHSSQHNERFKKMRGLPIGTNSSKNPVAER